jgi:hypothetical protein
MCSTCNNVPAPFSDKLNCREADDFQCEEADTILDGFMDGFNNFDDETDAGKLATTNIESELPGPQFKEQFVAQKTTFLVEQAIVSACEITVACTLTDFENNNSVGTARDESEMTSTLSIPILASVVLAVFVFYFCKVYCY